MDFYFLPEKKLKILEEKKLKLTSKYCQMLLDHAKQSASVALKTVSKTGIQKKQKKTAEAKLETKLKIKLHKQRIKNVMREKLI